MSNLKSTIESLAAEFARNIVGALRGASIEDVYALSSGSGSAAAPAAVRRGPGRPRKVAAASVTTAAPASPKAARAPKAGKGGRLGRRSLADIEGLAASIAGALAKTNGLRSEQIRDTLGVDRRELPRALKHGIEAGLFSSTGEKRATTYHVGGKAKRAGKNG